MYAIIKTGGKQFRVSENDVIDVELLDVEAGATVEFGDILFINDGKQMHIGQPVVAGYIVRGEILGNSVGPKETSLKYKKRQHTQKKWGHRQHYTRVKIVGIGGGKAKVAAAPAKEGTSNRGWGSTSLSLRNQWHG